MAKISELTAAGPLTGAETIPVVQDGETRRANLTALLGPDNEAIVAALQEQISQFDFGAAGASPIGLSALLRSTSACVEMFGANGDGVTNDSSHIAAAFAATAAAGLPDPTFAKRAYRIDALPGKYFAVGISPTTRKFDGQGATFNVQDAVYALQFGRAYSTAINLSADLAAGEDDFPLVAGGGANFAPGDDVVWQLGEVPYDFPETLNWAIAKVASVVGDVVKLDRPNLKPFTLTSVTWAGIVDVPPCKVLRKVPILRDCTIANATLAWATGAVNAGHALDLWGCERVTVDRIGAVNAKNGFSFQYSDGLTIRDCWQYGSTITVVDSGAFMRFAEVRNALVHRPRALGVRTFITAEAGADVTVEAPRFENTLLSAGAPRNDVIAFIVGGNAAVTVNNATVTGYGGYVLSVTSNGVSGQDGSIEFTGRTRLIHPTEPQYIALSTINGLLDIEIAGVRQIWDFANTRTLKRRVLLKNGMYNYINLPSFGPVKRLRVYTSPGVTPGTDLNGCYLYKVGGNALDLIYGLPVLQAGKVVEYPMLGGAYGGNYWRDRAMQNGLVVGTAAGTGLDAADEFVEFEIEVATLNNADIESLTPYTISEALWRGMGDGAEEHQALFLAYDLANIAAQVGGVPGTLQVDFAIADMAAGDFISAVSFTGGLAGVSIQSVEARAGLARVVFANTTAGAIDRAATDVRIAWAKPQAGI